MKRGLKPKGIFCLEGDWWQSIKRPSSVEPVLQLLKQSDRHRVPYIHRNVATRDALSYYVRKWTQKRYSGYPILYLGFHGSPGTIHLGDGRFKDSEVTLELMLQDLTGKCEGRIIHFASCGVLDLHGSRLNSFLKQTGALAVSGYASEDVAWLRSAAFEVLAFAAMQDNALTTRGARAIERRIRKELPVLAKELGFRMVTR